MQPRGWIRSAGSTTYAAMSTPKRKPGRPAKVITADHIRQIEVLAGYGLTEAAIAAVLDMAPSTFREKKQAALISGALARGRARAESEIGEALFNCARRGDSWAVMWWEKTRANRSDRVINEHVGEGGGPLEVQVTRRIVQAPASNRIRQHANGNGANGRARH